MINPSFQQLLYSQSLDTWVISSVAEVNALVDEVYQQFLQDLKSKLFLVSFVMFSPVLYLLLLNN